MANILSQDEVDALLSSFTDDDEGAAEPEAIIEEVAEPKTERKISVYDFRRPNRISKEQLRFLEVLHETFVVRFTGVLSGYFRTMVDMEILSVEQLSYGEWVQSLPETTCVFPFSMEPLQGSGAVELNPGLSLSVVDRLLGGQGSAAERMRDLTHLEQTILTRVADQMLRTLAAVWSEVLIFTPKIEGFDKQPNLMKLLPDPETVVLITFEMKTATMNGAITVCYPFVAIEPAMAKAGAGAFSHHAIKPRKIPEGPRWLARGIEEGHVRVGTHLGTGTVTIGEFIELKAGDVICLDRRTDQPIEVSVGNEAKFIGRPGLVGRKMAVQIIGPVETETDAEEPQEPPEANEPEEKVKEGETS